MADYIGMEDALVHIIPKYTFFVSLLSSETVYFLVVNINYFLQATWFLSETPAFDDPSYSKLIKSSPYTFSH